MLNYVIELRLLLQPLITICYCPVNIIISLLQPSTESTIANTPVMARPATPSHLESWSKPQFIPFVLLMQSEV